MKESESMKDKINNRSKSKATCDFEHWLTSAEGIRNITV